MQLFLTGGSPFLLSTHLGYPQTPLFLIPELYHRCSRCGTAIGIVLAEVLLLPTQAQDQVVGVRMVDEFVLALGQKGGENSRGVYELS